MKFGDGASVCVLQGRAQMTIVGRLTPDNALIYSLARLTHVHTLQNMNPHGQSRDKPQLEAESKLADVMSSIKLTRFLQTTTAG